MQGQALDAMGYTTSEREAGGSRLEAGNREGRVGYFTSSILNTKS